MSPVASDEKDAGRLLDWSTVRRVLLVRLRSIGDTVLMTPCLAALKNFRPGLEITAVSEPLSAPLLEDHPLIDRLLVVSSDLGARARLVGELRRARFDVGVNLHGGTTAMFLTRLSGARHTTAYEDYRYAGLLTCPAPAPDHILKRRQIHSVEQQLALLYWLGVPPTAAPPLSLQVSEAAIRSIGERLAAGIRKTQTSGRRFAVLAPAAAMESKRWPTAAFARVSEHIAGRWGLPSVVIAGPGQESIARRLASLSQTGPQVITGLGLKEVMALISLSSLFVGNDSGPMHIAAAFRRPVVGLFGSSNADVWRPWSEAPARVVQAAAGADPETRIRDIPVEAVTGAVDEVMEEAPNVAGS